MEANFKIWHQKSFANLFNAILVVNDKFLNIYEQHDFITENSARLVAETEAFKSNIVAIFKRKN